MATGQLREDEKVSCNTFMDLITFTIILERLQRELRFQSMVGPNRSKRWAVVGGTVIVVTPARHLPMVSVATQVIRSGRTRKVGEEENGEGSLWCMSYIYPLASTRMGLMNCSRLLS